MTHDTEDAIKAAIGTILLGYGLQPDGRLLLLVPDEIDGHPVEVKVLPWPEAYGRDRQVDAELTDVQRTVRDRRAEEDKGFGPVDSGDSPMQGQRMK